MKMHSFITNQNPNLPTSPDNLYITGETSIGIDQVREIQHFLAKKPFQSEKNIVVILDAHLLTIPAQNAMLKTLEEPPGNSEIYLVTSQPDLLLPTILSRCSRLAAPYATFVIPSAVEESLSTLIKANTVSERLLFLDSQSFTRESLGKFLDSFEHYLHNTLCHPDRSGGISFNIQKTYELIVSARKYLRANCSLRLLTTHIATNLHS